jgi:glycosyltransferase involved in cell wall biosynthesis
VDFPGSAKSRFDRALMVEPMRRWRDRLCRLTTLFVTPSADILPPWINRDAVLEVEWGADVNHFRPDAPGDPPFAPDPDRILCVFAGAFRSWHGAIHLVEAMRDLASRGRHDIAAVLIGDGPELPAVQHAAAGLERVTFTGALNHETMPACLAAADLGVAPFDVSAHAPLALDFFWSPLKVFEYMSTGLPVIAPDIPRLRRIVASGREGVLYDASHPGNLARALEYLADDRSLRLAMGSAARERAVREFGWDVHCRKLEEALRRCTS